MIDCNRLVIVPRQLHPIGPRLFFHAVDPGCICKQDRITMAENFGGDTPRHRYSCICLFVHCFVRLWCCLDFLRSSDSGLQILFLGHLWLLLLSYAPLPALNLQIRLCYPPLFRFYLNYPAQRPEADTINHSVTDCSAWVGLLYSSTHSCLSICPRPLKILPAKQS